MKIKSNVLALAVAAACACVAGSAAAQVSGDVVKIGFITDLSGVYSDIDGLIVMASICSSVEQILVPVCRWRK